MFPSSRHVPSSPPMNVYEISHACGFTMAFRVDGKIKPPGQPDSDRREKLADQTNAGSPSFLHSLHSQWVFAHQDEWRRV